MNRLSISITTNFVKSSPTTALIETVLNNLYWRFPDLKYCPLIISCDISNVSLDASTRKYVDNLRRLDKKFPSIFILTEKGFRQSMVNIYQAVKTPYLLSLQHDWLFLKDIDFKKILDVLDKYDDVHYVGFNKRENVQKAMDYILRDEKRIIEIPLLRSSRLSMNPHIVRKTECHRYIEILKNTQPGNKTIGTQIEIPLWNAYKKDIKQMGFEVANKKWGVCLYGDFNDKKIVDHLDGRSWMPK